MFGKKKRQQSNNEGFEVDERISELSELVSDDSFSSSVFVEPGVDDFDSQELSFGLDDRGDRPAKAETKKKSSLGIGQKIGIGLTIAIAGLIGIGYVAGNQGEQQQQQQQQQQHSESDSSSNTGGVVVQEQVGKTYTGNDNGNQVNGTGAILAYDYAYYTERDAEKARAVFNPEISDYPASYIAPEIDKMLQGTTYTVSVTPREIGKLYDVVLLLEVPGFDPVQSKQTFETMKVGDKFYVKKFVSGPLEKADSSKATVGKN